MWMCRLPLAVVIRPISPSSLSLNIRLPHTVLKARDAGAAMGFT